MLKFDILILPYHEIIIRGGGRAKREWWRPYQTIITIIIMKLKIQKSSSVGIDLSLLIKQSITTDQTFSLSIKKKKCHDN